MFSIYLIEKCHMEITHYLAYRFFALHFALSYIFLIIALYIFAIAQNFLFASQEYSNLYKVYLFPLDNFLIISQKLIPYYYLILLKKYLSNRH